MKQALILEINLAKIRITTQLISELGEYYGGRTPKNIIITEMSDRYDLSEERTVTILSILKRKGIIFEPQRDYFKII